MLQKAKSIKQKLKRSNSNTTSNKINSTDAKKAEKLAKKYVGKGIARSNSLKEVSNKEKIKQVKKDKLDGASAKVFQALGYMEGIIYKYEVEKKILAMLPESATILLEAIMEVYTCLSTASINQDSSVIISCSNHINQTVADLIKWVDGIMVKGEEAISKQEAIQIIQAVKTAVKDLVTLSKDKLQGGGGNYSTLQPKSPTKASVKDSSKRNSLPDIPLSPREEQILQDTKFPCVNDNSDEPPPKPPLPKNWESPTIKRSNPVVSIDGVPPPLPVKTRGSSMGRDVESPDRIFDMLRPGFSGGKDSQSSGDKSPVKSPSGSNTTSSPQKQDVYDMLHPGFLGNKNGGSPNTCRSLSPVTMRSASPGSSVGSSLAPSQEDLLGDQNSSFETRLSMYDNQLGLTPTSKFPVTGFEDLNERFNAMTSSLSLEPPSLPMKQASIIDRFSAYDNLSKPGSQMQTLSSKMMNNSLKSNIMNCGLSSNMMTGSQSKTMSQSSSQQYFSSSSSSYSSSSSQSFQKSMQSSSSSETRGFSGTSNGGGFGETVVQEHQHQSAVETKHVVDDGTGSPQTVHMSQMKNATAGKSTSHNAGPDNPNNYKLDEVTSAAHSKSMTMQNDGTGTPPKYHVEELKNVKQGKCLTGYKDGDLSQPIKMAAVQSDTAGRSMLIDQSDRNAAPTYHINEMRNTTEGKGIMGIKDGSPLKIAEVASSTVQRGATVNPNGQVNMRQTQSQQQQGKKQIGGLSGSVETFSSGSSDTTSGVFSSMESLPKMPPPLPIKSKPIHAYMGLFQIGHQDWTPPSVQDFHRNSMRSVNFYQTNFERHNMALFNPMARSNTISIMSNISGSTGSDVFSLGGLSSSSSYYDNINQTPSPRLPPKKNRTSELTTSSGRNSAAESVNSEPSNLGIPRYPALTAPPRSESEPRKLKYSEEEEKVVDTDSDFSEPSFLDEPDVSDMLIRKAEADKTDNASDIKGGMLDALVVHATAATKHDFMYQEAFLTTYRTMLTPKELIDKIMYRYNKFNPHSDDRKKRLARNAFSLLVRVVDELCCELDNVIVNTLLGIVYDFVCSGELMLARILRKKALEKLELKRLMMTNISSTVLSSRPATTKELKVTDFKAHEIAEQMTLLDAELFQKIEIPEVLLWAQEQSEELSPNLTMFTEHFNKMSYWCRSMILTQEDPKEREKYLVKFIKVMKHLRKKNNFNSYLAILSAVDSAPVRRLEWQKQNVEVLKDFCTLIDSSSSFRNYRNALAESEPPCIPYIGLVLQDLTFVHIGNQDFLPDGCVNFVKRWQQFNILDNMRRFKKCHYTFKKNPRIITFFNDFDDFLSEEALWQISESIKPRGGKKH
ncbi:unnamed protein product [Owenia fusiformis]|uniref:CRK SH3-binding GNRP n=1 Tax=Owenia fusiformis TaxID=6347 RepID=A0A8J1U071_OWEFU|nr:unnamed protein product [Owenia fusiformis]